MCPVDAASPSPSSAFPPSRDPAFPGQRGSLLGRGLFACGAQIAEVFLGLSLLFPFFIPSSPEPRSTLILVSASDRSAPLLPCPPHPKLGELRPPAAPDPPLAGSHSHTGGEQGGQQACPQSILSVAPPPGDALRGPSSPRTVPISIQCQQMLYSQKGGVGSSFRRSKTRAWHKVKWHRTWLRTSVASLDIAPTSQGPAASFPAATGHLHSESRPRAAGSES